MEGKKLLVKKNMIHKCIARKYGSYEKGNNISKRLYDEYSLWMLILSIPCPPEMVKIMGSVLYIHTTTFSLSLSP